MGTLDILGRILTITLFATTLRMTTPVLFATLGGVFSALTGIFNVGLEGLLTIGAFFAVIGSVTTGSAWGDAILEDYRTYLPKFWVVKPKAAELGSLIEALRRAA